MRYKIIATGSTGNCLWLGFERFSALIDLGVPYNALRGLRYNAILLTHEHSDHFKPQTLRRIASEHPSVWWIVPAHMAGNMAKIFPYTEPIWSRIILAEPWQVISFCGGVLRSFPLSHDVLNVGWHIVDSKGSSMMYATDTVSMDGIILPDLDYYFIEANYDEEGIQKRIEEKLSAGEYSYEIRARETHLSKEKAELWLANNAGDRSKCIFMHEHSAHNGDISMGFKNL